MFRFAIKTIDIFLIISTFGLWWVIKKIFSNDEFADFMSEIMDAISD